MKRSSDTRRTRRFAIGLSAATVLVATASHGMTGSPGARAATVERPSIVVILTDDQRFDELRRVRTAFGMRRPMPTVSREIVGKGVKFSNAFVVNSLCCPSRASILTGRYSHSTRVYKNEAPHGGFPTFKRHGEGSTVAVWLHRVGYRTGFFGKYLNQYAGAGHDGYVPRGWDRWVAFAENNGKYFNYDLNVDGRVVHHYSEPAEYSTDVLAQQAADFIHRRSGPLFVFFAPAAPHGPATPAPRDEGTFYGLARFRPPSYNERDVSDKPVWLQRRHRMRGWHREDLDRRRQARLETLGAVDDAVREILEALSDTGRLHSTMVVFTSDNGYSLGEHRWVGKQVAYEESIRIPLVIRYDRLGQRRRVDPHVVLNIDLAPTWAALGRANAPGVDGRSLKPLLRKRRTRWRSAFLVEHLRYDGIPTYCAVRSARYTFVHYSTNEEELYDRRRDPYELNNQVRNPVYLLTRERLVGRMQRLCTPEPPDPTFDVPPV